MALLKASGKLYPMGGDFDIFDDGVLYQSSTGIGEEGVLSQPLAGNGVICSEGRSGLSIGDFLEKHGRSPLSWIAMDDIPTGMEHALTVITKWINGGNSLRPGMVDFLKCYRDSFPNGKFWQAAKDLLNKNGEKGKDNAAPKNPAIPSLSFDAVHLLLEAEKGSENLLNWYVRIWRAWDELPLINDLYGGGYMKWRLGEHFIDLTPLNDPFLHGRKMTHTSSRLENGTLVEDKTEEEYRPYQFWNNARSLFQCFFMVFPEIDRVDTERVSGLGFKNPFLYLHEPQENPDYNIGKIPKETLFHQARACHDSQDFRKEWELLKAARKDNLLARIDEFWNVLSFIRLVRSPRGNHEYLVNKEAKTDTLSARLAAVKEYLEAGRHDLSASAKAVSISSEEVMIWIVYHLENDWEIKKALDGFIQEYQRPLRTEYRLAAAIEAFLNRPQVGKLIIGNEPPLESLPLLYQYLYLTFKDLYDSKSSKERLLDFANKNIVVKAEVQGTLGESAGEMSGLEGRTASGGTPKGFNINRKYAGPNRMTHDYAYMPLKQRYDLFIGNLNDFVDATGANGQQALWELWEVHSQLYADDELLKRLYDDFPLVFGFKLLIDDPFFRDFIPFLNNNETRGIKDIIAPEKPEAWLERVKKSPEIMEYIKRWSNTATRIVENIKDYRFEIEEIPRGMNQDAAKSDSMQAKEKENAGSNFDTQNREIYRIKESARAYTITLGDEEDVIVKSTGSRYICSLVTNSEAIHGLTKDQVANKSVLAEERGKQPGAENKNTNVIDEVLSKAGIQKILKRIEDLNEIEKDAGDLSPELAEEREKLREELDKGSHGGTTKKVFTDIQTAKNKERENIQTAIRRALKEVSNQKIGAYLGEKIEFKDCLFYYKGELFELITTE